MLAKGVLEEICRYGEYEKLYEKIATDDCEQQHVVNGFIQMPQLLVIICKKIIKFT